MSRYNDDGPTIFGYLLRLIAVLVLLGGIGLGAYAMFGDLSRAPEPRSLSVDLPQG